MRVIQLQQHAAAPYGCRTVLVTWDDGTSTSVPVPPTVEESQTRQWLEGRHGKGVRGWRQA